jgi:hypothetical protein
MIVSHKHRFIFFHNPKCAGMSFRDVLAGYHDDSVNFWGMFLAPFFLNGLDHSHLRLWEIQAQYPKTFMCARAYNSVIFVRNPYDRFLSAVNENVKKFQPQIDLRSADPAMRLTIVEAYIKQALNISRITTDWRYVHFSPQTWFIRLGDIIIPRHIVPVEGTGRFMVDSLERLGLPEMNIPHINASPVDLSCTLRSPIVRTFIQNVYQADFEFFRNSPGLEHLAAEPL